MKYLLVFIYIAGSIFFSKTLDAQEKTKEIGTIQFKVEGVCDMCKTRIENAALIKGVKFAEWDKEKQEIKVVYRTDKTTEETIHKAIAEVGHDTSKQKASDEAYTNLPKCCAYREGVAVH